MMMGFMQDLKNWAKAHDLPYDEFTSFDSDKKTMTAYTTAGKIYQDVVSFLNAANLYGNTQITDVFSVAKEDMSNFLPSTLEDSTPSTLISQLYQLVQEAKIPQEQQATVMSSLGRTLSRYINRTVMSDHWVSGKTAGLEGMSASFLPMESIYPSAALADMSLHSGMPGQEAFGASIDTVIPDIRMALTVVLLKPHKGVMSRLIQRRTLAGAMIMYQITRNEMYDLQKSQDKLAETRNGYEHRYNLVDLYRNPDPTDMTLTPIIPLKSRDTDGDLLVDDGIIVFGKQVNLFNLVLEEEKAYRNKFNYTDLVSEGVVVEAIHITVKKKDGSKTEKYKIPTFTHPKARLMPQVTSNQFSGDRETILTFDTKMSQDSIQSTTGKTELFAGVVPSINYARLRINVSVRIDIQTANTFGMGMVQIQPVASSPDVEVTEELKTLVDSIEVTLDGFELDAKYSEENLRQVNRAARSLTYMASYEMPQGKTVVVDFSMNQTMPEQVLNVAQELQSIGIDHRNTQMFLKTMRDVHDSNIRDANDKMNMENTDGRNENRKYVSGQQVNPEIFLGTIDLSKINSIRDSDTPGDIRQYVDSYITKALSIVHYKSQYLTQLDNSKVPTYKVLTSSPIQENLLAIPHIHEHLMPNGMQAEQLYKEHKPGEPIEYTRTLMSGVKLECITSNFYYLQDTIMIIPYVDGDPSNVLNFAHNWDLGQFVANYTPVDNNEVNRRVFMNTREWPIVTCPIGAIIKVIGLETHLPDLQ